MEGYLLWVCGNESHRSLNTTSWKSLDPPTRQAVRKHSPPTLLLDTSCGRLKNRSIRLYDTFRLGSSCLLMARSAGQREVTFWRAWERPNTSRTARSQSSAHHTIRLCRWLRHLGRRIGRLLLIKALPVFHRLLGLRQSFSLIALAAIISSSSLHLCFSFIHTSRHHSQSPNWRDFTNSGSFSSSQRHRQCLLVLNLDEAGFQPSFRYPQRREDCSSC